MKIKLKNAVLTQPVSKFNQKIFNNMSGMLCIGDGAIET
jgi:hypothetical protein